MKDDVDSSSDEEDVEKEKEMIQQTKREKMAANNKLKKDLEEERKELGKVLMSNRQRKLYQQAQEEAKGKKSSVKKLKAKRDKLKH